MKIWELGWITKVVAQEPNIIRNSETIYVSVKEWTFNSNTDRNNFKQKTESTILFRKKYDKETFMSEWAAVYFFVYVLLNNYNISGDWFAIYDDKEIMCSYYAFIK